MGIVTVGNSVTAIGDQAFYFCSGLKGVYFKGNAPVLGGSDVFNLAGNATVYYLPRAADWPTPPATFGGRPAVPWNPQVLNDASFGVVANLFGFTITGTSGMVVVVEACTDLANWSPLQTIPLAAGSFHFSDADWTNHSARFYRLRMP
jgi:hypothetical protein